MTTLSETPRIEILIECGVEIGFSNLRTSYFSIERGVIVIIFLR